jgi:hypothetical protein
LAAAEERVGGWPTAQEEMLLAAALRPEAEALAAWEDWQAIVGLERADVGSRRLLPQVYRRLREFGVAEPGLAPLKSVYRHEWYRTQVLLHHAAMLLRAFQTAEIETLLLKGAALVARSYQDAGLRPMNDFDVLVPTERAMDAMELLAQWGWRCTVRAPRRYVPAHQGLAFKDESGREVDLHWHVLWECCAPGADDEFWKGAIPASLGGAPTLVLNDADQLLHVCVHGLAWNEISPIRWVVDAMSIVNAGLAESDWRRLVVQAHRLGLTLQVRGALHYLHARWDAPVPASALEALERTPVSRVERLVYQERLRPPGVCCATRRCTSIATGCCPAANGPGWWACPAISNTAGG